MRFNSLQVNTNSYKIDSLAYMLDPLRTNTKLSEVQNRYQEIFKKERVKNISFSQDGFFSLILSLKGKIAVSLGESEYIIQGAKKAQEFGADLSFIGLNKDGTLGIEAFDDSFDFVFVSSYIVDTYVKVDLELIKEKTKAKIISNGSADLSRFSDIYLLDSYKLSCLGGLGVVIYNDEFEDDDISQINLLALDLTLKGYEDKQRVPDQKEKFLSEFKKCFGDDLFIFVDPKISLEFTLHLGLRDIKMRDIIRTLAFEDIFITNGEGCSLGLSQPSRILQEMGYSQDESRWGLSLDFSKEYSEDSIKTIVEKIYKKYRQIKVLG